MTMQEIGYIALRKMTVHELDDEGRPRYKGDRPIVRECAPGDPLPEAKTWSNLWREVRAGRVGMAGTALTGPALADSMRRKVEADAPVSSSSSKRRRSATAEEAAVARATGQAPGAHKKG